MKRLCLGITECIVSILITLFFLALIGCKTPVKVTETVKIDSIYVKEAVTVNYDSIMQQIVTHLSFDFEYTLTEWSKPDSSGVQYKEKEHHLKGKGQSDKSSNSTTLKTAIKTEKDSANIKKEEVIISTPVKTLTWWNKVRIKVGNYGIVIILIGIGYVVYWLIRRKI